MLKNVQKVIRAFHQCKLPLRLDFRRTPYLVSSGSTVVQQFVDFVTTCD